jgi:hypothetical protein
VDEPPRSRFSDRGAAGPIDAAMNDRQAPLVLGIAVWLVSACGLPTSGIDNAGSASASSGSDSSSGAGGATSSTSGGGSPTTTATTSSQSAGGGGAGVTTTATSTAETTGAGGAPPCTAPDGVCCGGEYCDLSTSKCCAQQANMTASCIPRGIDCGPSELDMQCDDKTDCPGEQECCADWSGFYWIAVQCKSSCSPPISGGPAAGEYPQCIVGTQCTMPLVCQPDLSHFGPPHGYCNPF